MSRKVSFALHAQLLHFLMSSLQPQTRGGWPCVHTCFSPLCKCSQTCFSPLCKCSHTCFSPLCKCSQTCFSLLCKCSHPCFSPLCRCLHTFHHTIQYAMQKRNSYFIFQAVAATDRSISIWICAGTAGARSISIIWQPDGNLLRSLSYVRATLKMSG